MCGIFGILSEVSREELAGFNDRMIHRGPDDTGLYLGDGVGLAARRLSIIDLAEGHQPLSNEDGRIWITYNGEVYNAPQLRAELEAAGHTFRTQTDTEVVIHAYEAWGEEAVARLRGMFAFALWDGNRRRLLLARDRFGMKPLYYGRDNGRFAFASEIRPILAALPNLPRQANPAALWRLFELGYIPSPLTAFDGIFKVPAAHLMIVEEGARISLSPYWQPTYPLRHSQSQQDTPPLAAAADAFLDCLRETVDAWRMSDVPVGSLLSGGIDSASLAALLTEISGTAINTFTIAFAAASHDEAGRARATADFLGSRHHELTFSAADFDHLPNVVRHLEEPQCSATSIPIYLLYRACHEAGFKVIMTGEGADELLGGYPWFDGDRRLRPLLSIPRPVRALLARAPLPISAAGRRVLAQGNAEPAGRYALWQQNSTLAERTALLQQPPPSLSLIGEAWRDQFNGALNGRHPLDQFLYLESQTRLVDFINFEVDRMSMANSVEARPPFLDHELWQFCATLPPEYKLPAGGALNKHLLRRAMAGRLPPAVLQRPKKGLAAPHAAWWRAERLPAWAEDCLHPAALVETGYFQPAAVSHLRYQHQSSRADHSRLLMGILTTQLWHQNVKCET
jgi:asparagine synthase (glutamine-hydrolysing)